ncbi:hypothetical protein IFM89_016975 [Coptis chinensis]|uniref:Endonuclease/exonuclease/phosphatase domain-containing protein n=1 Tax=Coptis chinensis TaxID=261450 RepID=A0A835HY10_9MAGN|nr:hypothetical protein IFM89_016975 [Coptis chinensis]
MLQIGSNYVEEQPYLDAQSEHSHASYLESENASTEGGLFTETFIPVLLEAEPEMSQAAKEPNLVLYHLEQGTTSWIDNSEAQDDDEEGWVQPKRKSRLKTNHHQATPAQQQVSKASPAQTSSLYVHRRRLWSDIGTICSVNMHMLIIGDFNAYLFVSEKKGGLWPTAAAMNDFRALLDDNQLLEVPSTGFFYTCTNRQLGNKRILGKIDRGVYNSEWSSKFPSWSYKALSRQQSDHTPLIGWHESYQKPRNAPFKFHNMWTTHPGFLTLVQENWQIQIEGSQIFILAQKLKRLIRAIKSWNRNVFGHLETKINE